jgi:hypothetical protein
MNSNTNNNLVKTLTGSIPDDLSTPVQSTSSQKTFLGLSITGWIIIILILALLGINIFTYLAKGTQETASLLGKFLGWFQNIFGITAKQTINVSETGAKAGISTAANLATTSVDIIAEAGHPQGNTENKNIQSNEQIPVQRQMQMKEDSLHSSLNQYQMGTTNEVHAHDGYAASGKAGWCYIGEQNGIRNCAEVGVNDICMSGDIFPTMDVCVNPNLRP